MSRVGHEVIESPLGYFRAIVLQGYSLLRFALMDLGYKALIEACIEAMDRPLPKSCGKTKACRMAGGCQQCFKELLTKDGVPLASHLMRGKVAGNL